MENEKTVVDQPGSKKNGKGKRKGKKNEEGDDDPDSSSIVL